MKEVEDKESSPRVKGSKAKKENLEVAGEKCRREKWQIGLKFTGEIFNEGHISNCKGWSICCCQAKMGMFFRDLDLALHCPFRYGGLHNLCHCLLQQLAVG